MKRIDKEKIGERLRLARELWAYTPSEVQESTGIDQDRLHNLEQSKIIPSGDEILILSSFYKKNFIDFVIKQDHEPFQESEILFRRYGKSFTKEDRQAIQEFIFLCQTEHQLESALGIRKIRFDFIKKGENYKSHGKNAAEKLRAALDHKNNEVHLDMYSDFRNTGIHVFRRRLSNPEISGLYIFHPSAGHCILINYNEDIYRQRFSAAHEAAHAIFDSNSHAHVSYFGNKPNHRDEKYREIRANAFSSHYLMPETVIKNIQPPISETLAKKLSQELKVSTTALAFRLKEAGIISESSCDEIKQIRVNSIDKVDPEIPNNLSNLQKNRRISMLERGLSDHYVGICFEAYHAGHISAGRLCEALMISRQELTEVSLIYGRSIHHAD
jgi:Zn-dependent peptidase ImmA (M78 family)